MTRMLFEEVDNARKILGFGITADLITIKKAYRKLVKDWHPDKCNKKDEELCHEKTKEINKAYKIILKYIENYRYSLAGIHTGGWAKGDMVILSEIARRCVHQK